MKLGIGTLQFGTGTLTQVMVRRMLDTAQRYGIRTLETLAREGVGQETLGQAMTKDDDFRILVKIPTLPETGKSARLLEELVLESLGKLNREHIDGLLLSLPERLLVSESKSILERIANLKQRGLIGKAGASVRTGAELDRLLGFWTPDIVQFPLNVLDQRFVRSGHLMKLREENIEIHAHSIFLQGVILAPLHPHPFFWPIRNTLEAYHQFCVAHGLTPLEGALSFVAGLPAVHLALVGAGSVEQLEEIGEASRMLETGLDFSPFSVSEARFIDPAQWQLYE